MLYMNWVSRQIY